MEISNPLSAKVIRKALAAPRRAAPASDRRVVAAPSRRLGRLFRRDTPTTFQRCLAVHMHFAQHPSALD